MTTPFIRKKRGNRNLYPSKLHKRSTQQ